MPRRARITLAGIPLHLIQRGNNRQACFYCDDDYINYLDWLGDHARRTGCSIHAFVLMTNHVHLLVSSADADAPGVMMKRLGQRYVQYINRTYRRSGSLWEGRYRSEWNDWACEQWAQSGHKVLHAELYGLLLKEARDQQIERIAAKAVSRYLAENIAGQYPMVAGDRFESETEQKGIWSITLIEAVYGTNTGPFCIIKAKNVLPSGILGDITQEFWSHNSQLKKLRPFWKPCTWRQVQAGDACILNGADGMILHADASSRMAVVNIDGTQKKVKKLAELLVPVMRVE